MRPFESRCNLQSPDAGQRRAAMLERIAALRAPEDRAASASARSQPVFDKRGQLLPVHGRTAELGGHLRSGLEDAFYLPDGSQVTSNAPLIGQLAQYAHEAGREVASTQGARQMLGLADTSRSMT